MARFKGALLALLAVASLAAPAAAQIGGHPFEISGGAGVFSPDMRARMDMGPAYTSALGLRFSPLISAEANGLWAPSNADTADLKHNFFVTSLDLRWSLRPAYEAFVPYLILGAGYATSRTTGTPPDYLARGAATVGAGLMTNVMNQRWYLRFQARDIMFRERAQTQFSNHLSATVGLQYVFLGHPMDADKDGVRDGLDKCPDTPIGATVDANGCPSDTDGDGVLDGIDRCNDTPKGCTIDSHGCQTDADGDGVCDGIDQCPDTPKGATVDAKGCPSDSDGDGVLDGIDQCPDTPKGATVDAKGCPSDADGDGVPDGIDVCPNTPAGYRVDPTGCPIEVTEKEIQLLDTGSIRIQNINFDTGKAKIKPESYAVIDTVASILAQYPSLRIEIGGHTDNTGSPATNDALSQERADSVLTYLRERYPDLPTNQYSARGYGSDVPVAPNRTAAGRARNRRVEFRVLNTDQLRIEREKRRFLLQGEGIPAPPKPAPADSMAAPAKPAPADSMAAPAKPAPPDSMPPSTPAPPDTTKQN